MNNNVLKVARWEFAQNLKSKLFLILTVVIPLIMIVIGFVPNFLANQGDDDPITLYILDEAGLYDQLDQRLNMLDQEIVRIAEADVAEEELITRAKNKEIDGYFSIKAPITAYQSSPIKLYSNLDSRERLSQAAEVLEEAMTRVIGEVSLVQDGYDPDQVFSLLGEVSLVPVKLEEETRTFGQFILPFGVALMIVLASMFSGSMVMTGIIKEKTNRVVEIVLSSVDSYEMIAGKLLGFAGLGLAQIAIWATVGLVVLTQILEVPLGGITVFQGFYYFCYFVLGYLMIASLYALLGASTKDLQSSNQSRGIFVIVPLIPIYLTAMIVNNPTALWVRLISFFPPFTPTMMLLRSAFGEVPVWEIWLSLMVLAGFTFVMVKTATKVFRVGMLMYGKDMSLKEIIRWSRS